MEIPVLVEPTAGGFRAAAAPLALDAVGPTPDAALDALRTRVAERVAAGAHVRTLTVPDGGPAVPSLRLADNPLFDRWLEAVEEYRRQKDEEETAAEAAGGG